jgi:hypothetical protein
MALKVGTPMLSTPIIPVHPNRTCTTCCAQDVAQKERLRKEAAKERAASRANAQAQQQQAAEAPLNISIGDDAAVGNRPSQPQELQPPMHHSQGQGKHGGQPHGLRGLQHEGQQRGQEPQEEGQQGQQAAQGRGGPAQPDRLYRVSAFDQVQKRPLKARKQRSVA